MKTLIWKIRFSLTIRRLVCAPWRACWMMAGSNLEMLNGDTSECPKVAAEDEREAWLTCL